MESTGEILNYNEQLLNHIFFFKKPPERDHLYMCIISLDKNVHVYPQHNTPPCVL